MKDQRRVPLFFFASLVLGGCLAPVSPGARLKDGQTPPALSYPSKTVTAKSAALPAPPVRQANGILVVYPKDKAEIDAPSTFVVGSCSPTSTLTLNGLPVKLNKEGFFAHVIRLTPGSNTITLCRDASPDLTLKLTVNKPLPPPPLPGSPLQILKGSIEPKEDMGLRAGDIVEFAVRGTPMGRMRVQIGKRTVDLASSARKKGQSINLGLDTAYGVTYQRSLSSYKDLYTGFYRVQADDRWSNILPRFILTKAGRSVQATGLGHLSVLSQPYLTSTIHPDTIVRLGPGKARTTPLPEGVRLLCDGFRGDFCCLEAAPGRHFWIEKKDLSGDDGPGLLPSDCVRTVNLETEGARGARVVIPLNQRLPYQIEQQIKPNRLVLRIFGATADTDWITSGQIDDRGAGEETRSGAESKGSFTTGKTFPSVATKSLINFLTWGQLGDRIYQVTLNLNVKQQWGFWADYEGSNLILHVKGTPDMVYGAGPLSGLIVCLDPGHGGNETGSLGCSGIPESAVNLAIALKLKQMIEKDGATVIMTRQTNDMDVSLATRVDTAVAAHADLLISVHNNALPDGRDPMSEHGTSSYWYHGQAIALSRKLKEAVAAELGFPDTGARYQNLALCRPSRMLSALVEVGFMINPDEYAQLITPDGQEKAAAGLEKGIRNFILQEIPPVSADLSGTASK